MIVNAEKNVVRSDRDLWSVRAVAAGAFGGRAVLARGKLGRARGSLKGSRHELGERATRGRRGQRDLSARSALLEAGIYNMVFYIMGPPLNGVLYNGAPLNGVLYV